ncbi:MAG TPA: FimV/HubP family polar landmark protein [Gammaproteobacteria bacterium]|nr:FimV/HubP family polar landmark protein [Gammaproteobacteria bacterium]
MLLLIGGFSSIFIFLILFWFASRTDRTYKQQEALAFSSTPVMTPANASPARKPFTISSKDIEVIAGDDVMTTQLDLARAYIETDRKNLAKNILHNVMANGSPEQQREAKHLLQNNFH